MDDLDHDQRFKELIREFFADFLRLFFADWAARFDLTRVDWLDKELHPDPPDGTKHLLDLVARVRAHEPVATAAHTTDPTTWLVLVHIEIESPDKTTLLTPRLPGYYRHLRERHGLPVLPVVVYLKVGLNGIGTDDVTEAFWELEVSRFRYLYVGLPALNAEEYVAGENWLGVALSALMRMPRERAVELGAEALRRLSEAPVSEHRRHLLGDCVEAYLDVGEQELRRFHDILEANATGRVAAVNKTRVELARERGSHEGQSALLKALVLELFEARLGTPPAEIASAVSGCDDIAVLRHWHVAAGTAATLQDFRVATCL